MTALKKRHFWRIFLYILGLSLCLQACASKGTVSPVGNNAKNKKNEDVPKLTKPTVRRVWVPAQMKENGTVYEDGYWRYLIEKESVWSR